jgi:lipoprotein NlpI
LAPERRGIYANRGLVSYVRGDYRQAAQDLSLARERMPDKADLLLWLYLAEARSGSATAVAELDAKLEPQRWPYPVGKLFRGRLSADKTLATAKDAEERCGAHFYIGEWQLIGGDRQAAVDSLQAARDICPKDSMEFMRVEAELQRLLNVSASSNGAAPATE